MNKVQVHIVFKEVFGGWEPENKFVGCFFDRKSAEDWIAKTQRPSIYFIETYEQPEFGMAHEVFD